ncbi:MAG: hypothetical protein ACTHMM_13790 [Agriterribacter sp.]
MKKETISIEEIIGKTITDIRCKYGKENDWLDTVECFIELDHKFYIDIPYGQSVDVLLVEPDAEAETLFGNLSDIPCYSVNEEGRPISEVVEGYKKRKRSPFNRIRKLLFGYEPQVEVYKPYKVEHRENKLRHIVNRSIVDYLWQEGENEKGFFELDNGYLISEEYMAPCGTGLAGLHYYSSISDLKANKGANFKRYSEIKGNH